MNARTSDFSGQLKDRIADRVGAQSFKVWFKNATEFSLTGDIVRVGVPNQFIGNWIERHFADDITSAAKEILNQDVGLTYALEPTLAGAVRKTQLNFQARCAARTGGRNGYHAVDRPPANAPRPPRGTFESFVVGDGNRLAYSSAMSLARRDPQAANPLFIHGPCGLGKTHLLQAMFNASATPAATAYVSAEDFTNQYVHAVQKRQLDAFRRKYRTLDVLLIDDVHFLAGKKGTQEEFLHTFNAIYTAGKLIALASDAHPRMIGQLSDALMSRFISGLVVRLQMPDVATRREILRRRLNAMQRDSAEPSASLPPDVIDYVADVVQTNIRELESALLRVLAYASLSGAPATLTMARQALDDHLNQTHRLLTADQIESACATFFGLSAADLRTSRKTRTIALARSLAMYLARKHTDLSFPEIARIMGNKNHSTVLLACRRMECAISANLPLTWQSSAGPRSQDARSLVTDIENQLAR